MSIQILTFGSANNQNKSLISIFFKNSNGRIVLHSRDHKEVAMAQKITSILPYDDGAVLVR